MKLHTSLTDTEVFKAMNEAHRKGRITPDVRFVRYETGRSRSHPYGYIIQLGTYDSTTGPTNSRHYKNTGTSGAYTGDLVWAATYDEWGWFIAEVMEADPKARFGYYKGIADFNRKTNYAYTTARQSGQ